MLQRVQTQVSELLGLGMGMNRDHPAFLPELVETWHLAPRSLDHRQPVILPLPLPVPPAAPSRVRSRTLRAARPRSPTLRLGRPILFSLVPEQSLRSLLGRDHILPPLVGFRTDERGRTRSLLGWRLRQKGKTPAANRERTNRRSFQCL